MAYLTMKSHLIFVFIFKNITERKDILVAFWTAQILSFIVKKTALNSDSALLSLHNPIKPSSDNYPLELKCNRPILIIKWTR